MIVLAVVFYAGLLACSRHDPNRSLTTPTVTVLGLAILVAILALIEAWRWAGRPRPGTSRPEAITAALDPATKKTVRRMALGRGPHVPELSPRAAAWARAQQQSTGPAPALLALVNVSTLAQSTGTVTGLVLAAVTLMITVGLLGWPMWLGHRARVLNTDLATER